RALDAALGGHHDAHDLPFDDYAYADAGNAIRIRVDGRWLQCGLGAQTQCRDARRSGAGPRPPACGGVRDLSRPADETPHRSPDGYHEAFVQDGEVAVRTRGGEVRVLTGDGSPDDFYDPESIVWSPDSSRFALYRVRPGDARMVTRVETA